LPDRANFCPTCGAPVVVPAASELRVVTVVFADLAGSTELATRVDPERLREVLAAFHGMVAEEVAWYGGVVEGFIGDAVLGVFGAPVAHDDDAVRAIRAGLAIVERAEELTRELALPLPVRVRVGINTGRVAVGTAADRNIVIGAEVNVGARLQQAAEPGEVLVGATTRELARGEVTFGPVRRVPAKGFDQELPAWPVVEIAPSRPDRTQIPFVDRRRELALLEDTYRRARERRRAHLVTLLGEPGIGKTRLVEEFLRGLPDDVHVLTGRSSPFEELTFWPIAQMLYRFLAEERGATPERLRERLRAAVAPLVAGEELEATVRGLALAMGLEEPRAEERHRSSDVARAFLSLVAGLAASGPVVLVFDNLQEAHPELHDLLERLAREVRELPLLVLAVARWGFLEERPSWAGGIPDAVTLWVEPLAAQHATQLAIEAGGLDRASAERVATHAGGNPLFIVEITGMLLREGRSADPPAGLVHLLPPSVHAVVAARIDQLSPAARELLRRAALWPGGRIDRGELELVADVRDELLAEAEDEELLVRDEDDPQVWRFRSDVIRDVAYQSLTKRERRRLHLRAAEALSAPELVERYPRTIAFHLEQAARASLDLNPNDRSLVDRAVDALVHAGDLARRRADTGAAADLYERALALAGPEASWGVREARICSMLGETLYWRGEFERAEELLRRALAMAPASDEIAAHAARFLADVMLTVRGDDSLATALFERALEAARRLDDPHVLTRTLLMAGWGPYWRGELAQAERLFREALDVARSIEPRDASDESRALLGLASVIAASGEESEALALRLEALAIAEEAGLPFAIAAGHQAVGESLRRMLRLDEALEHAEESVRLFRDLGARWELASALGDRGSIHRLAGRLEEAEADLREALALCRDLKERALVSWTAAELVRTLALRGDLEGARRVLEDPAVHLGEAEPDSRVALLLAASAVELLGGDPAAARERALEALAVGAGPQPTSSGHAGVVWWVARLFGDEDAGGPEAARRARALLEAGGRRQALAEPELLRRAMGAPAERPG
jgi:class 3 adenylate cyclase/predicted ATPase